MKKIGIIGAGVIGCAIARAAAQAGHQVTVLDAASAPGQSTTGRNSQIIHAGVYYPKDSLKARLCLAGRHLIYDYCTARNVPFKQCGKLIVATHDDQVPKLKAVQEKALANGLADAAWLTGAEVTAREPQITAAAALFIPATGIFDVPVFVEKLIEDAQAAGAEFLYNRTIIGGRTNDAGHVLEDSSGQSHNFDVVINASGLTAHRWLAQIKGFDAAHIPRLEWAKGNYFRLNEPNPFQHLTYPIPVAGGLGIHVTFDLQNNIRFGPDVEWIAETGTPDYTVDPTRRDSFYAAIRTYWPQIDNYELIPAFSGVRPKLVGPGEPDADFLFQTMAQHGVKNWLNLFGIESPGLTSSLAIGDYVLQMIDG